MTTGCAADPFAIQQVCLQWLRTVLHAKPFVVTIALPQLGQDDMAAYSDQHESGQTEKLDPAQEVTAGKLQQSPLIVCQAASEVMGLFQKLDHPKVCPCHAQPLVHQQHPEGCCSCPVTRAALAGADLKSDSSAVQVNSIQSCPFLYKVDLGQCVNSIGSLTTHACGLCMIISCTDSTCHALA